MIVAANWIPKQPGRYYAGPAYALNTGTHILKTVSIESNIGGLVIERFFTYDSDYDFLELFRVVHRTAYGRDNFRVLTHQWDQYRRLSPYVQQILMDCRDLGDDRFYADMAHKALSFTRCVPAPFTDAQKPIGVLEAFGRRALPEDKEILYQELTTLRFYMQPHPLDIRSAHYALGASALKVRDVLAGYTTSSCDNSLPFPLWRNLPKDTVYDGVGVNTQECISPLFQHLLWAAFNEALTDYDYSGEANGISNEVLEPILIDKEIDRYLLITPKEKDIPVGIGRNLLNMAMQAYMRWRLQYGFTAQEPRSGVYHDEPIIVRLQKNYAEELLLTFTGKVSRLTKYFYFDFNSCTLRTDGLCVYPYPLPDIFPHLTHGEMDRDVERWD